MIDLYTASTPNGWKVSVTLEELQIPYEVHPVNLSANEQKQDWFVQVSPNGRIPAIVDRDANDLAIFESGAIMIYLAEKAGRLLPSDAAGRASVIQWVMFQMSGIGPMMGQANVFYRYFPEKIQPAIDRYQNESRRLFEVLDNRLAQSQWLAGDFSIADIANWCWVRTYKWSGVECDDLVHLKRWRDEMRVRPACETGVNIPAKVENLEKNPEAAKKFADNARNMVQT